MRLVFSFCQKDRELSLKVLKWAASLDRTIEFPTLLCFDASTDATEVLDVARDLFLNVETFVYPTPKALPWPRLQNRVFQACARHIQTLSPEPWFWWEPDLTPLRPGWYRDIAEAHEKGGKPFSGHIVSHMGHMTGCGVYPHTLMNHSTLALLADFAPWDVQMKKDMIRKCHPINDILQHQYFIEGECPTFPSTTSLNLISDTAVTFHRCKDGSLIDRLRENKSPTTAVSRVVKAVKQWVAGISPQYGIIAYVPPPNIGHPDVFFRHLDEYPPKNRLYLMSDYEWPKSSRIPDPTVKWQNSDRIASTVFMHALKLAEKKGLTHFIYLESDCRMIGENWDVKLFDDFTAGGNGHIAGGNMGICSVKNGDAAFRAQFEALARKFGVNDTRHKVHKTAILTHKWPHPVPIPFVNGAVGVYSVKKLRELFGDETPDAAVSTWYTVQDRGIGEAALKRYSPAEVLSKFKHMPEVMATAGERLYTYDTRIAVLTEKKVTCVHPIKTRWRPAPPGGYSFLHAGDLGDIIYALKAIQLIGGGKLVLTSDYKGLYPPRSPVKRPAFDLFKSFLERQSYISGVEYSETGTVCTYDMSRFREFWNLRHTKHKLPYESLVEMNCYNVGVEPLFTPAPWLTADSKAIAPIIIHRSQRYNEPKFPWGEIVQKFGRHLCFVGLPEEHKIFTAAFGKVAFYQPVDFDDLAAVINGAKWFLGNQSFPCAIALGLGKNVYQETYYSKKDGSEATPDCQLNRPNFFNQRQPLTVIRL